MLRKGALGLSWKAGLIQVYTIFNFLKPQTKDAISLPSRLKFLHLSDNHFIIISAYAFVSKFEQAEVTFHNEQHVAVQIYLQSMPLTRYKKTQMYVVQITVQCMVFHSMGT